MKQEEPEVPNKDPKKFQTLKLSAQSSSSVAPDAQKPSIVTGPLTPKAKQMPVRRGDVPQKTSIPTQPAYTTGRPIAMPPGPGTSTGPRQPPTPPPSGVVEPPEPSSDQAKVKFWRDRALQAEARLQEREHQIRQQSQEILDLSWKAKVAADWTQWWEHHLEDYMSVILCSLLLPELSFFLTSFAMQVKLTYVSQEGKFFATGQCFCDEITRKRL